MKEYIVTALEINGLHGRVYKKGAAINADQLPKDHFAALLQQGFIEEKGEPDAE